MCRDILLVDFILLLRAYAMKSKKNASFIVATKCNSLNRNLMLLVLEKLWHFVKFLFEKFERIYSRFWIAFRGGNNGIISWFSYIKN